MSKQNGRQSGHDFPCVSLDDALHHLRRPPTPAAVRFKIQSQAKNGDAAQIAAYIDARLVFDRLDQVCGQGWAAVFEPLPDKLIPPPVDNQGEVLRRPPLFVRCRLTVLGVTRQDVGEGSDPKAAFSDAIKRAAVHFGIGRALYAMRLPWLREGEGEGELRRNRRGYLILDQRTEAWCRERYGAWLEVKGARQFGEPLDHGDEPGAAGFEADREEASAATPVPVAADDRKSDSEADRPAAEGDTEAHRADADGDVGETKTGAATSKAPRPTLAPGPDLAKVEHWRAAGGYRGETVEALGALVCGELTLERLTTEQVNGLALTLEIAVRGNVGEKDLLDFLTRFGKREDRDAAARDLRGELVRRANEAQLTPPARRAA